MLVQPHHAKAISARESLLPRVDGLPVQQRCSDPLVGHLLRMLGAVYFEDDAVSGQIKVEAEPLLVGTNLARYGVLRRDL